MYLREFAVNETVIPTPRHGVIISAFLAFYIIYSRV